MRNSKITEKDKNYGPYINSFHNTLSIGYTQTMYFKPTDHGPFHMSPSDAESKKHDRRTKQMSNIKYTVNTYLNVVVEML